jgi:hypothetical protein
LVGFLQIKSKRMEIDNASSSSASNGNGNARFYHLLPVGLGREHMNAINIDLKMDQTIQLGRNPATGLVSQTAKNVQFVSRNHAEICVTSGLVYVKPTSRQANWVHKNGTQIRDNELERLDIGDTVTLLGKLNFFSFELKLGPKPQTDASNGSQPEESSQQKSKRARVGNEEVVVDVSQNSARASNSPLDAFVPVAPNGNSSAANSVISVSSSSSNLVEVAARRTPEEIEGAKRAAEVNKELEDHSLCSICLEPIAFAHNLQCGCCFCYECIIDWAKKSVKCPNCNTEFNPKALINNRALDNMISSMLKLNAESIKPYEERLAKGKERKKEEESKAAPARAPAAGRAPARAANNPVVVAPQPVMYVPPVQYPRGAYPANNVFQPMPMAFVAAPRAAVPVPVVPLYAVAPPAVPSRAVPAARAAPPPAARANRRQGTAAIVDLT